MTKLNGHNIIKLERQRRYTTIGKGKSITFLVFRIILTVLTILYVAFFAYLACDFIIQMSQGKGLVVLVFVLLWAYLFIPACILFLLSLVFFILAISFKNYPRKVFNIIYFAILTAIPIIVQVSGIVIMSIMG